jgi:hypothetical protein
MRRVSKKRATRNAEAQPFRRALLQRVGHCEICGHDPKRVRSGVIAWALHVHEICRGSANRHKAMDKPFATLVVCFLCHDGTIASKAEWPEARQLAALKRSRPADYDLGSYNALVGAGPKWVSMDEVAKWMEVR